MLWPGTSKSHYDIPISFIFSNTYENHWQILERIQVFHATINLMWTAFPWKPWKNNLTIFFSLSLPLSLAFSRWLWRWTVFTRKDGWDLEVSPSWPLPKPFSEAPRPLTAYREQRPTTIWWDAWRRYVTPVELERGEISWTRTARTFKEMDGTLKLPISLFWEGLKKKLIGIIKSGNDLLQEVKIFNLTKMTMVMIKKSNI